MSHPGWDGETDDWFADGYAAEAEAKRTAKYTVTFEMEYDPEDTVEPEHWLTTEFLTKNIGSDINLVVTDVTIEKQEAKDE